MIVGETWTLSISFSWKYGIANYRNTFQMLLNKIFYKPLTELGWIWPITGREPGRQPMGGQDCVQWRGTSLRGRRAGSISCQWGGWADVGAADCLCSKLGVSWAQPCQQPAEGGFRRGEGVSRGLGPSVLSCELSHCKSRPVTSDSVYRTFLLLTLLNKTPSVRFPKQSLVLVERWIDEIYSFREG